MKFGLMLNDGIYEVSNLGKVKSRALCSMEVRW